MKPFQHHEDIKSTAFDYCPGAILVTSNRIIVECNKEFCKLFGFEKKDLIDQSVLILYPSSSDYEQIGRLRYEELLQDDECIDERFMRCKDGEVFWCQTHGKTLTPEMPFNLVVLTFTRISTDFGKNGDLTAREREVSTYIANGHTCKEIAKKIDISHRTVEAHKAKIMKKLECRNTAELVSKIINLKSFKKL